MCVSGYKQIVHNVKNESTNELEELRVAGFPRTTSTLHALHLDQPFTFVVQFPVRFSGDLIDF